MTWKTSSHLFIYLKKKCMSDHFHASETLEQGCFAFFFFLKRKGGGLHNLEFIVMIYKPGSQCQMFSCWSDSQGDFNQIYTHPFFVRGVSNSVSVSLIYRSLNIISDPNPDSPSAFFWQPDLISFFISSRENCFIFLNIND